MNYVDIFVDQQRDPVMRIATLTEFSPDAVCSAPAWSPLELNSSMIEFLNMVKYIDDRIARPVVHRLAPISDPQLVYQPRWLIWE